LLTAAKANALASRIEFYNGQIRALEQQFEALFPLVDRTMGKIGEISDSLPEEHAVWGDSDVNLMHGELRRNIAKIELQFKELLGVENSDKGT
jgi:hypothetical protein